jgi:hypothetical protein
MARRTPPIWSEFDLNGLARARKCTNACSTTAGSR